MGLLDNRVAVVTGAGRGIGQACALTLVREGASVVINDVDEAPAAEARALAESIRPSSAAISVGSVADRKVTDRMFAEAAKAFGKVDILVNNAGITRDAVVHRMEDEQWDLVLDVNLRGTFNCIRSAAPYLRDAAKAELEKEGRPRYHRKVVNFCSTAAYRGNPGQANYVAAKMGNVGLARVVAQEWARFHVNVNTVAPGVTLTRLTLPKEKGGELGIPAAQLEERISKIPFGYAADPQDIANVVLFFCSPLSDYVTGQLINVSGGLQIP